MDDDFTILFIIIGIGLISAVVATIIIRYRRGRRKGRVLAPSPVIITSSTTTSAPGAYPVAVGGVHASPYHGNTAIPMPMPPTMTNPPYPTHGGAMPHPYGSHQGYAANPPYPVTDPSRINPPSYDQVISAEATQKQAPYNPNYMGN